MVLPVILLGHEEIDKELVFIRIPYTTLDPGKNIVKVKSSRNKKELNEVTAAPFLVSFSQLLAAKQNTQNGGAVMSLRSFLFPDDFSLPSKMFNCELTGVSII